MAKWSTLGLIVLAFVAGTATTGMVADASEKPNGQPFQALWDAIGNLQNNIISNDETIEDLETRLTALETANLVELYEVETTLIPPPQTVELNCNPGDSAISGNVIFPDGVSAQVNSVSINDGEGMVITESGATELSKVTFQIICSKELP